MKMKRCLAVIVILFLMVNLFAAAVASTGSSEENEGVESSLEDESINADDPIEIYDWHDLNETRNNLSADYVLMNNLNESTEGYMDYNDPDTDGWEPIGGYGDQEYFIGTFDGQEKEIRDLYINRSDEDYIGVFGILRGKVENIGVVDAGVSGDTDIGGLVGENIGTVNNSYAIGNINGTGDDVGGLVGDNGDTVNNSYATGKVNGTGDDVGGLVGENFRGTVKNSYTTGKVNGTGDDVGGLVGENFGTVNNSYATGNVNGNGDSVGGLVGDNGGQVSNSYATGYVNGGWNVGGLVGDNYGTVNNSYATGDVNGESVNIGGLVGENSGKVENSYANGDVAGSNGVGGLVGENFRGTVKNSHYNIDEVLINGGHHVTIGGLYHEQYLDWIDDKNLDIENYSDALEPVGGHYDINDVQGIKDLLGFAWDDEYKFRLADEIDLSGEKGLYIPYLRAVFDGNGYTISNLQVDLPFVSSVGMFGYNRRGAVCDIGLVDTNVSGYRYVGGLVGENFGTVNNSYATGDVSGDKRVGGLAGHIYGTVSNSYATGDVSGSDEVGGLFGHNFGTVSNSYATGDVSGDRRVGGLIGKNDGTVLNSYATGDVSGSDEVGGLVGFNYEGSMSDYEGSVSNSYATGDVSGNEDVGGLVGENLRGTVSNSYARVNVRGDRRVGGLVGHNWDGRVAFSYATGHVSGDSDVGGHIGYNEDGEIRNSFWNTETTGQDQSEGGTPKTTQEMKDVTTFTDLSTEGLEEPWDFVGNPNDEEGDEDIWDIDEDGEINNGYPYLKAVGDNDLPRADAGDDKTVEVGEEFTLDASDSSDNLGIASYEWGLDNGDAKTGEQITYTYDEPGNYTVELTVTDEAGNTDTDTVEITVEESGDGDGDGDGIPGFTSLLLLTATIIAVAIYQKKSKKR